LASATCSVEPSNATGTQRYICATFAGPFQKFGGKFAVLQRHDFRAELSAITCRYVVELHQARVLQNLDDMGVALRWCSATTSSY